MKQSPMYKEPTMAQRAKIEAARKRMRQGMEGEKSLFAKLSTTEAKAARDEQKMAKRDMEKIPESVRNYENEEGMITETTGKLPNSSKKEGVVVFERFKKGGMASKKAAGGAGMTRGCGAAVKGKNFKGVF